MRGVRNYTSRLDFSSPLNHIVGIEPSGLDKDELRDILQKPHDITARDMGLCAGSRPAPPRSKSLAEVMPGRESAGASPTTSGGTFRLLRQVSRFPTRRPRLPPEHRVRRYARRPDPAVNFYTIQTCPTTELAQQPCEN